MMPLISTLASLPSVSRLRSPDSVRPRRATGVPPDDDAQTRTDRAFPHVTPVSRCRGFRNAVTHPAGPGPGLPGEDGLDLSTALEQGMAVAYHAARAPERLAILSPSGDRTFGELNARINRLARGLRRRGLRPGDAVAIMLANRPEFAEALGAAYRTGLRLTAVNVHLTGAEAGYIVDDSDARAFVADAGVSDAAGSAAASRPVRRSGSPSAGRFRASSRTRSCSRRSRPTTSRRRPWGASCPTLRGPPGAPRGSTGLPARARRSWPRPRRRAIARETTSISARAPSITPPRSPSRC